MHGELSSFIEKGINVFDDETFNLFALREFEIQYNSVDYLRNYSNSRGITPETIKSWEQIPALPTDVFKNNLITAFPSHKTELTLMTSGTSNPKMPGKIYRDKSGVELVYLANSVMTRNFLFPDVERMRILLMVPSPKLAPAMGMAVGLEQMRKGFGTEDSIYLISPEGMEWELMFQALHDSEESGEPVAIVGATSGLVYFFNFCRQQGLAFRLPPGSRICDGGGYLGVFGECSREDYLRLCYDILGISPEYCVNTLGSAESGTNYFDNVLRNGFLGIKGLPRYKMSPPWARTIAINPETGRRVPRGEVGLLCHYDLANRSNLFAIRTNNFGYETEDGFEITGRADTDSVPTAARLNSMIKGKQKSNGGEGICSTVADEMLTGNHGICSTVADDMLARSPHGDIFNHLPAERFERLKKLCPFLKLQKLLKNK